MKPLVTTKRLVIGAMVGSMFALGVNIAASVPVAWAVTGSLFGMVIVIGVGLTIGRK